MPIRRLGSAAHAETSADPRRGTKARQMTRQQLELFQFDDIPRHRRCPARQATTAAMTQAARKQRSADTVACRAAQASRLPSSTFLSRPSLDSQTVLASSATGGRRRDNDKQRRVVAMPFELPPRCPAASARQPAAGVPLPRRRQCVWFNQVGSGNAELVQAPALPIATGRPSMSNLAGAQPPLPYGRVMISR
jgi:hypothetical protein